VAPCASDRTARGESTKPGPNGTDQTNNLPQPNEHLQQQPFGAVIGESSLPTEAFLITPSPPFFSIVWLEEILRRRRLKRPRFQAEFQNCHTLT